MTALLGFMVPLFYHMTQLLGLMVLCGSTEGPHVRNLLFPVQNGSVTFHIGFVVVQNGFVVVRNGTAAVQWQSKNVLCLVYDRAILCCCFTY